MRRTMLLRAAAAAGAIVLGAIVPGAATASTADQSEPPELAPVDTVTESVEAVTSEPAEPVLEEPQPPPPPAEVPEPVPEPPEVESPAPSTSASEATEPAAAAPAAQPGPPAEPPGPPADPPQDPPGNNGTVKVDGGDLDSHPDNEPHVGCTFQIDFYGYDQGELNATITFEGIAPTGGGELLTDTVFIGEDAAGGGVDLDASVSYDLAAALTGIEPHPEQGHHVKLTVHADGSQGADTKHKAFWVEGCATPPEEPPPEEPPPTTPPPTAPPTTAAPPTTTAPMTTEPPMAAPSEPAPVVSQPQAEEQLPVEAAPAAEPTAPQDLPRTGSDTGALVMVGTVLLGLGLVTRGLARRAMS